tara:strand:- start:40541 stop:40735 length:195 start_codon:yes stop_codon:yes gene_type:complete
MLVIAACHRRYSGSTLRWHNKEYGHFKLALREGLASFLASFWEFERGTAIPAFPRFARKLARAF